MAVRLIDPTGKHPVQCVETEVSFYLEKGWVLQDVKSESEEVPGEVEIASTDLESGEEEVEETIEYSPRQQAINDAVVAILLENKPEDFTGAGLPKVEVIGQVSGVQQVSGAEREIAMSAFQPPD